MKHNSSAAHRFPTPSSDRRKSQRFDTSLAVFIRFIPDGTPISGAGIEVGPNGMRLLTKIPLAEAAYIHVSFDEASNQTFCEGRVVWTRPASASNTYESGVDIQRWGGDTPEPPPMEQLPNTRTKRDRRRERR